MTPEQKKTNQLAVAQQARTFLDSLAPIKDLDTKAALIHDKIAEGVKAICVQHQGSFTQKQTEVLVGLAVHVALVMDPSQKTSGSFFGKLWLEFKKQTPLAKVICVATLLPLGVGAFQMFSWGYQGIVVASDAWDRYASKPISIPVPSKSDPLPLQTPTSTVSK